MKNVKGKYVYYCFCRTQSPISVAVEIDQRKKLLQTLSDPEMFRLKRENVA